MVRKTKSSFLKRNLQDYGGSLLLILLGAFSVLACVKTIFFGLNIDEEYAVTMAYRMLGGDSMFVRMWEPHQTSGFVCALFIRIFLLLSGGTTDGLIVYLRIVGILLHACVCLYVYRGLRKICSVRSACLLSLLCFAILPKGTVLPEFSNLLLWVMLSMFSGLLQMQAAPAVKGGQLVVLGLQTCVGVLAYPSFLLCFPVYCVGIYYLVRAGEHRQPQTALQPGRAISAVAVYVGTCFLAGAAYVSYFVFRLGFGGFVKGVRQMATDGEHSASLGSKMAQNGWSLLTCMAWYLVLYVLLTLLFKVRQKEKSRAKFVLLVLIPVLVQGMAWLGASPYFNEPLLLFYHIFITLLLYGVTERAKGEDNLQAKAEVWAYVVPPVVAVFAASLLTNTGIYVISFFLLPAIVVGLAHREKQYPGETRVVILCILSLFLFAKGWLLCETEGYKADMLYVKQKALSGPAKNIYCRYTDGYEYNIVQELMDSYVTEEDNVLCVSGHTIWYLLSKGNIATYSTISTPTFDERLLSYYEEYPDKYPDVVIMQEITGWEKVMEMLQLEEPVAEQEGIAVYYTRKRNEKAAMGSLAKTGR